MPQEDTVRVLRLLEYIGPRSLVEDAIRIRGVHGERMANGILIREAILGNFPEIIKKAEDAKR